MSLCVNLFIWPITVKKKIDLPEGAPAPVGAGAGGTPFEGGGPPTAGGCPGGPAAA